MLVAINGPDECFTGAWYNVLQVVAAYPLDAWIDPRRSEEIKMALQEDQHPIAMLRHAPLLASLATCEGMPTILSSLTHSLKRAREGDDIKVEVEQPKRKSRKELASIIL